MKLSKKHKREIAYQIKDLKRTFKVAQCILNRYFTRKRREIWRPVTLREEYLDYMKTLWCKLATLQVLARIKTGVEFELLEYTSQKGIPRIYAVETERYLEIQTALQDIGKDFHRDYYMYVFLEKRIIYDTQTLYQIFSNDKSGGILNE